MEPKQSEHKENGVSHRRKLLSAFVKALLRSAFQTAAFIFYLAFSLSEFFSAPKVIFLFAAPLSLVGLWLLLYHFDLVSQAAKRHWNSGGT